MSEEEKRKKFLEMWEKEQLANECVSQFLKYREAKEYIDELENKIDKAIEYLKDNACYENTISELFCDDLDNDSCMELLNILRGKDNE